MKNNGDWGQKRWVGTTFWMQRIDKLRIMSFHLQTMRIALNLNNNLKSRNYGCLQWAQVYAILPNDQIIWISIIPAQKKLNWSVNSYNTSANFNYWQNKHSKLNHKLKQNNDYIHWLLVYDEYSTLSIIIQISNAKRIKVRS